MPDCIPSDESALLTAHADSRRFTVLVVLCTCIVLTMCTWFSASAVLPQLRAQWSLSGTESAWLTIAVQLGFVAGALTAALTQLPDRMRATTLIAVSASGAALVNIGLVWSESLLSALTLRLLTGFFLAGVYPPALKFISTWFKKQRGLAMGAVIGALTLGSALPHVANATLDVDWRWVIISTTAATMAGGVGIISMLKTGPYPFPQTRFEPARIVPALMNKVVILTTLGYLAHMWELYAMWAWIVVFLQSKLASTGGNVDHAPIYTFLIMAAGAPACLLAGIWADRIGRTATLIAMLLISGLCAALIGLTYWSPLWITLMVGVIWGASIVADSAQFSAMVKEGGDPRYIGTALTVQLGLGFGLTTLSIWLIPLLADRWGWSYAFLVLVPGPLVGLWAMLALRRCPESAQLAGGKR